MTGRSGSAGLAVAEPARGGRDEDAATTTALDAHDRLLALCDPGSLRVVRSRVVPARHAARAVPGDGVIGATGTVDGRPVACFAQDATVAGGSLGVAHAETILRVLELARRSRAPVIGFVQSAGARVQEGAGALGGYGRIFRAHVALAGVVPQISVVTGNSAGGGSYAPALTDVTIMTRSASMFLTGPAIVREAIGEDIDAGTLGGAAVHERNGVCQLVADDDAHAVGLARELVTLLAEARDGGRGSLAARQPHALRRDPSAPLPPLARQVYDVRDVARALVDDGRLLELSPRWAANVVTAFARVDGRPVGIVANQPRRLGGVLDSEASQKAARFVSLCDAFGVPLLVLVDAPGFLPGSRQERAGVIRHGAGLVRAFAAARVPRITVVLRKAFGGACITMNSKDLGADLVLAWPQAQIGVMAARQAVALTERAVLAAAADRDAALDALSAAYAADHLSAEAAAGLGVVDEVIEPLETRDRVVHALELLSDGAAWR